MKLLNDTNKKGAKSQNIVNCNHLLHLWQSFGMTNMTDTGVTISTILYQMVFKNY